LRHCTPYQILGLVKDHHYQIACGKYYEQVHNLKAQESVAIEHPTQYFKVSMAHYDEKKQASQPSQPSQGQGSQHASQTPQVHTASLPVSPMVLWMVRRMHTMAE
jgi:hypothetical protein